LLHPVAAADRAARRRLAAGARGGLGRQGTAVGGDLRPRRLAGVPLAPGRLCALHPGRVHLAGARPADRARARRGRAPDMRRILPGGLLWATVAAWPAAAVEVATLRGYWKGQLERHGSLSWFGLELVPADSGRMTARISLPAIRGYDFEVGPARAVGDSVFAG